MPFFGMVALATPSPIHCSTTPQLLPFAPLSHNLTPQHPSLKSTTNDPAPLQSCLPSDLRRDVPKLAACGPTTRLSVIGRLLAQALDGHTTKANIPRGWLFSQESSQLAPDHPRSAFHLLHCPDPFKCLPTDFNDWPRARPCVNHQVGMYRDAQQAKVSGQQIIRRPISLAHVWNKGTKEQEAIASLERSATRRRYPFAATPLLPVVLSRPSHTFPTFRTRAPDSQSARWADVKNPAATDNVIENGNYLLPTCELQPTAHD
ncbi:hypothetical protein RSOLAG1IB_11544 [Rhizoctonia solani AG-1 IB]|uniref:Uncharacterized protein n=1 Tax=Thanatephorus cucumeris (strain AG1-IB / isolate 7/3/14) TaxID=1108050 RepID=A0A0B7FCS5_THACB|nr:hypothetical protein RSOLAG1IB_11544 [Rhizoctonia solani AG-1 IB]